MNYPKSEVRMNAYGLDFDRTLYNCERHPRSYSNVTGKKKICVKLNDAINMKMMISMYGNIQIFYKYPQELQSAYFFIKDTLAPHDISLKLSFANNLLDALPILVQEGSIKPDIANSLERLLKEIKTSSVGVNL